MIVDDHDVHVPVSASSDVALCGAVGNNEPHWPGDVTCIVCISAFKRRQQQQMGHSAHSSTTPEGV